MLFRSLLALSLAGCATATGVGGADYAINYDFWEFYGVANNRRFQVVVSGNPFPALSEAESNERLLPVMQANRPARPRVTWTYDAPAERPRPDYRMALVYNAANDLTAQRVCDSQFRHKTGTPGRVSVFAVYCRNERALSQTTAWSDAAGPDDPRLQALLAQLFLVLFDETRRWRVPVTVRPGMRF